MKCYLFLYADDAFLTLQNENVKEIVPLQLYPYNSLTTVFVELNVTLNELKLNIVYGNSKIKQYTKVAYLGWILDESLSGESMALYVLDKINSRL